MSTGREHYALREMAGPINRTDDGVLGPYSLEIKEGQWLNLPRSECPALNFHGPNARFSLVSWVKRKRKTTHECEAIAGMWNETAATRQYCLFLNLHIWDSIDQACGHLSATGAPSPGYKFCMEAAIGSTHLALNKWYQIVLTFDGVWGRIYVNGKLDYRPGLNPFYWPQAINDGGDQGSDFTVGGVFRNREMGNWFAGSLGGLAIYDQALPESMILSLYANRTL